ncbi:MAG: hypothetical protein ACRDJP_03235, partial [Actinomycetota bacterium]
MKPSHKKLLAGAVTALTAIAVVVLPAVSASAAISFRTNGSSSVGSVNSTTLSIPKPSGLAVGDFMVAMVTVQGGNTVTISPPTENGTWTPIHRQDRTNQLSMATYRKFATSDDVAETTFDFGVTGPNRRISGGLIAYTGVD